MNYIIDKTPKPAQRTLGLKNLAAIRRILEASEKALNERCQFFLVNEQEKTLKAVERMPLEPRYVLGFVVGRREDFKELIGLLVSGWRFEDE